MRIYVADLADYNAGTLRGGWIDLEGKDADDIQQEINLMLADSKHPNVLRVSCTDCAHIQDYVKGDTCDECGGELGAPFPSGEEWAIHDHEGIDCGENPDLDQLVQHAAMIAEHGEAWEAYCDHVGEHYATPEGFEESYQGEYDSEKAFAEYWADEVECIGDQMPEHLAGYFDYDAYARDLFIYSFYFSNGHVFMMN